MECTRTIPLAALALIATVGCASDVFVDDLGEGEGDTGSTDLASLCTTGAAEGAPPTPADIVIAMDNSSGMDDEAALVQEHLPEFLSGLRRAGVDARITLITSPFPGTEEREKNGICLPAPEGSGACPDDSNPPLYVHVPAVIESRDALSVIADTHGQWRARLREGADVHFLLISDDNADDTAADFIGWMADATPPLTDFHFHTISASQDKRIACEADPLSPCCTFAAREGTVYRELAELTDGTWSDFCDHDFWASFEAISAAIVLLSCSFENVPVG